MGFRNRAKVLSEDQRFNDVSQEVLNAKARCLMALQLLEESMK